MVPLRLTPHLMVSGGVEILPDEECGHGHAEAVAEKAHALFPARQVGPFLVRTRYATPEVVVQASKVHVQVGHVGQHEPPREVTGQGSANRARGIIKTSLELYVPYYLNHKLNSNPKFLEIQLTSLNLVVSGTCSSIPRVYY